MVSGLGLLKPKTYIVRHYSCTSYKDIIVGGHNVKMMSKIDIRTTDKHFYIVYDWKSNRNSQKALQSRFKHPALSCQEYALSPLATHFFPMSSSPGKKSSYRSHSIIMRQPRRFLCKAVHLVPQGAPWKQALLWQKTTLFRSICMTYSTGTSHGLRARVLEAIIKLGYKDKMDVPVRQFMSNVDTSQNTGPKEEGRSQKMNHIGR